MQRCQVHKAGRGGNEVFRACGKGREEKVTECHTCDISEDSDDLVERRGREEFCREGNK